MRAAVWSWNVIGDPSVEMISVIAAGHRFPPYFKCAPSRGFAVEDGSLDGVDVQSVLCKLPLQVVEDALEVGAVLAPEVGVIQKGSPHSRWGGASLGVEGLGGGS